MDKNISTKPERKRPLELHRLNWEDNVRWTLER
jgi:hypothetical protein